MDWYAAERSRDPHLQAVFRSTTRRQGMETKKPLCPVCEGEEELDRRDFLRAVGTTGVTAAAAGLPLFAAPKAQAAPTPHSAAETAVKVLYDSLTDLQKKEICFDWNYKHPRRGLL